MIFYTFVSKSSNCNCINVLCVKEGGYVQALQFALRHVTVSGVQFTVTMTFLCMNVEVKGKRGHQKPVPILQTCWFKEADKQFFNTSTLSRYKVSKMLRLEARFYRVCFRELKT